MIFNRIIFCATLLGSLLWGCRGGVNEGLSPVDAGKTATFGLGISPLDGGWGVAGAHLEDTICTVAVFIYRASGANDNDAPILSYLFSQADLQRSEAIFPLEASFLSGSRFDIYTVVNSRDTLIISSKRPFTRAQLNELLDSAAIRRYNSSSYKGVGSNIAKSGGFTMSGFTSIAPDASGRLPVSTSLRVKRTVGRIEVNVETDTAAFRASATTVNADPNATLQISAAWLLRSNRKVKVFETGAPSADDYFAPYTMYDSLKQDNDAILPNFFVGKFVFHVLENPYRREIIYPFEDARNNALKLKIRALYDSDGNQNTANDQKYLYFDIPVKGDLTSIKRNWSYAINVTIAGVNATATELKPISVMGNAANSAANSAADDIHHSHFIVR